MQSLVSLLRLGVGGMLLEPQVYREQRDAEHGLRRGLLLVLLVSLLSGAAALIGSLLQGLAQPSPETVVATVYDGVRALPWYAERAADDPSFAPAFDASFDASVANLRALTGGGAANGLTQLLLAPVFGLLGWLIGGLVAHLLARALGGRATLTQTLSTTALSAGAGLLGLVLVVPFARVAGATLLSLLATYVAIREAHGLSAWRSFWATVLGPLILIALALLLGCALLFLLVSVAGALSGASQP